jgi:hypothetical protein
MIETCAERACDRNEKESDVLIGADELLIHQVPRPLSQTGVTNHRFYHRH